MTTATVDPETVDFILAFTKDGPEKQLADASALDTKAVQVFTVGSVLMGLAGLSVPSPAAQAALVFALISYLVLAALALWLLWPKSFRRTLHADRLWPDYWSDPIVSIKHALVADASDAYAENRAPLRLKQRLLRAMLVLLALETFTVGFALIVRLA